MRVPRKNNEEKIIVTEKKVFRFGQEIVKTYEEEVIEVLSELEKNGIDIYDKENYPGMHLKTKENNGVSVKKFFAPETKVFEQQEKNNFSKIFKK